MELVAIVVGVIIAVIIEYVVIRLAVTAGINASLLFADHRQWDDYRDRNSRDRMPSVEETLLFGDKSRLK